MVTSYEALDIVQLVYFTPALGTAIYVCTKHGFKRQDGWLTLIILCLLHLISGATGIAAVHDSTNTSLWACSLVTSSLGTIATITSLNGLSNRVNIGTGTAALSPRVVRWLQIISLAAIGLSIAGAVEAGDYSDSDSARTGKSLTEAAIVLILVQFVAILVVIFHSLVNRRRVMSEDRNLLILITLSMPFVLVRIIYAMISSFRPTSAVFGRYSTGTRAVVVRGCMAVAMEIVAVTLYLVAGVVSPRMIHPPPYARDTPTTHGDLSVEDPVLSQSGDTECHK